MIGECSKQMTIREDVLVLVVACSMFVGPSALASGTQKVRGVVFDDCNGNGLHDEGEPGIAQAAISNQEEVVLSGPDGQYEIAVTDDTIIFVSNPSGYTSPVDGNNLPQFYYIHKPKGSPTLHYAGVAPTGPLPESLNFPMRRRTECKQFSIVVMADPQPESIQEAVFVRDDVLSELVGVDAAFAVTLGDLVSDQLSLIGAYVEYAGKIGIPFYNVIGNHDMNYDATNDEMSDETFHRYFGPNYYSWNCGDVHFVALDSVDWMGRGKGGYRERFGDKQLRWLSKDLASVPDDHLVVLCMHIPISTPHRKTCVDAKELFAVLKDRKRVLALSGHTHLNEHKFYGPEDGWVFPGKLHEVNTATVSGCWWGGPKDIRGIPAAPNRDGVPNGYTVVTFDGSDYVTDYRAAGFAEGYRMRIYPPGTLGNDDAARRTLLVNVFSGSDKMKVEYSLDGNEFQPMCQRRQRDPLASAVIESVISTTKPWATTVESFHMWSAELESTPSGGAHVVRIRATDQYGRIFEQGRIFSR